MCADCEVDRWTDVAQEVLDNGGLTRSDQTFLEDVVNWMGDQNHVTQAQVEKIKEKADLVGVTHE